MSFCKKYTIDKTIHEFKTGELTNRAGTQVTNPKQAIAISIRSKVKCPTPSGITKSKIVALMSKAEVVKLARKMNIDIDTKATKEELSKKITKKDLVEFLKL
jgi:polyferredoxin